MCTSNSLHFYARRSLKEDRRFTQLFVALAKLHLGLRKPKQQRLLSTEELGSTAFGGDLLKKSNAKTKRPFSPRAAIHVVMRTRGAFSLLKRGRRARVAQVVAAHARRQIVHVHRFANAGNHLHFLVECREQERFQNFLRAVSGAIALLVKIEEGQTRTESFWLQRPWTRLVAASGRAFVNVWRYVDLNEIEGGAWGISRREAQAIQYGDLGPPRPWLSFA